MTTVKTISTPAIPAKMVRVGETMEELTAVMEKIQASTTLLPDDRDDINRFMHLSLALAGVLQTQTDQFKLLSERLYAQNCELSDRLCQQYISKHQPRGNA
ncbi:MAG: hypothetical protein HIU83_15760 [Proteobacteria bacterium]|nr:hypothetical protein [Pseudomonadota bacterium]